MSNEVVTLQREVQSLKGQVASLNLTFAALAGFLNTISGSSPSLATAALDSAAETAGLLSLAKEGSGPEMAHAVRHIEMLRKIVAGEQDLEDPSIKRYKH